jgi:hypothetical protein
MSTIERLDHPALILKVPTKIRDRILELQGQLASGAAKDWPDYQYRIGVVRGLMESIDICEQVEKELMRS